MVNFFLNIFDINDLFINIFRIFILTLISLIVEKSELIDIFYQ